MPLLPRTRAHTRALCAHADSREHSALFVQWKTTFTNNSDHDAIVGLTPNRPAKVVPVDMTSIKANGAKGLHTKQGAWMASIGEVHLSISTECNPCKCCCAGQGMVRMMLQGTGTAFLEGHGTIMTKVLQAGEKIVVDQNSVRASPLRAWRALDVVLHMVLRVFAFLRSARLSHRSPPRPCPRQP